MKRIIRMILIELAGLLVASQVASGMVFENPFEAILITSVALGIAMRLIRPVINILLLPLTLATMGAFKIVGHAITLFVVDVALSQFEVVGFHFAGFVSEAFEIPAINLDSGPFSYLAFSIVIWFVTTFLNWIRK